MDVAIKIVLIIVLLPVELMRLLTARQKKIVNKKLN